MNPLLVLYSRKNCCLCETLEQRLNSIPLTSLTPPLKLEVIDIDSGKLSKSERALYDFEVPILQIIFADSKGKVALPRVSPRLSEEGLLKWLQKVIQGKIQRA